MKEVDINISEIAEDSWLERGKETFSKLLMVWSFAFIAVLFLMYLLYSIDSLSKFFSLMSIARICAGLIVILSAFSLIVSLLGGFAAMLPGRIKGIRMSSAVIWLNLLAACVFSIYVYIKLVLVWFTKITKYNIQINKLDLLIVGMAFAFSLIFFLWGKYTPARFLAIIQRCKKPIAVLVFLSVTIVAYSLLKLNYPSQAAVATARVLEKSNKQISNVILITFDALSAENMSLYGYERKTTPNIEEFAKSAYVFSNMISNGNWTTPSMASFTLGKYPSTHRVSMIAPDMSNAFRHENIANILKSVGYHTAMVTGNVGRANPKLYGSLSDFDSFSFRPETSKLGINSKIENFISLYDVSLTGYYSTLVKDYLSPFRDVIYFIYSMFNPHIYKSSVDKFIFNSASEEFNIANNILLEHRQPVFLWCHVFPPHDPYLPMSKYLYTISNLQKSSNSKQYEYLRDRYDELIMSVDEEFGHFIRTLKKHGNYDNTIIIVSADHGEVINNSKIGHGGNDLSRQLIHIPLLIRLPGQTDNIMIASPAEQVDIAPTILDYLGLNIPAFMEGESLRPYMQYGNESKKPKFSMNLDEDSIHGPVKNGIVAVVKDEYKFIHNFGGNSFQLYNLRNDPNESKNLAMDARERVKMMSRLILDRIALSERNREYAR